MGAAFLRNLLKRALISALALHAFSASSAMAMRVIVPENQIVSLANAPALRSFTASVDEAGRPSLYLSLEFANECHAEAGPKLELGTKTRDGAGAVLIISQKLSNQGCPDIYQPTKMDFRALLPTSLSKQVLSILARPAPRQIVRHINLDGAPKRTSGSAVLLESYPRKGSELIPELDSVEVKGTKNGGYILGGAIKLAATCDERLLRTQVFEIPDSNGVPRNDAVLITAPESCRAENGASIRVSVRIDTPQALGGRHIVALNASPEHAIKIAD